MLKITARQIVVGMSTGILAGLLVVAFESDFQGEICEYNQTTKHEDCPTYSLFPFLLIKVFNTLNYYGVAITALATVAIGGFTGTLWYATIEQGRLTQQSIDLARAEFISTHRPKIIVRNVSTTGFVVGLPIKVLFMYINIGETTANIAIVEVSVFLRAKDSPISRGLRLQTCEIINPALSCGESGIGETNSSFNIEVRDVEHLQSGKKVICIVGCIQYKDDRGILRRTGFARECRHIDELRFELSTIDDEEYEYAY